MWTLKKKTQNENRLIETEQTDGRQRGGVGVGEEGEGEYSQ